MNQLLAWLCSRGRNYHTDCALKLQAWAYLDEGSASTKPPQFSSFQINELSAPFALTVRMVQALSR